MSKKTTRKQTLEEKNERITAITDKMNTAVNSYFETPEQMKEYLSFMSNFYGYSPRNSALIHSQFKGAQAVGSFKFWKDKGFAVQKGEKGIQILVPNKSQPKFKDKDGKWKNIKYAKADEIKLIEKGELEKRNGQTFFSPGYVFDISQTNATAEDLPEIFPNRWLEGEVADYNVFMDGLKQIGDELDVTIGNPLEELGSSKGAFYYAVETEGVGHIGLNPRNSELQNVKTLIHELAHAKLHHSEHENHHKLSSAEKEFQAELTAFSVASYFSIDTSEYSLSYLANWTKGKEMNDKGRLLNEVRETSVEFVEVLEKELFRNKALEKEGEVELSASELKSRDLSDKNKVHWYEMIHRPVSLGCQPDGFVKVDHDKGRHGIVAYDRELSEKELNDYEMKSFHTDELKDKKHPNKEVGLER